MKPDIIKKPYEMQVIEGYVGVFCECGNVLHIKNVPEKAGEYVKIECPCGSEIETVYMKEKSMKETWDLMLGAHVEMPDRMGKFLEEIDEVCRKHGLSISHEDGHGAFVVREYSEHIRDWLFEAYKGYMEEDEI